MITIAETYINVDINSSLEEKEALKKYLIWKAKQVAIGIYGCELEFDAIVEDGSTKGRLFVLVSSLYVLITGYGSLRSGIDYMVKDSKFLSEAVLSDVINVAEISKDEIIRMERRLGLPGKIQRLFKRIDNYKENEIQPRVLKKEIIDILKKVENEKDKALILDELPSDIKPSKDDIKDSKLVTFENYRSINDVSQINEIDILKRSAITSPVTCDNTSSLVNYEYSKIIRRIDSPEHKFSDGRLRKLVEYVRDVEQKNGSFLSRSNLLPPPK